MTPQVLPQFCSRPEAGEFLIAALILYHRSGWAAPGGFKEGRAAHLSERVHAYLDWYRETHGAWPSVTHLSAATDLMIEFVPMDGREKKSASPWVLDSDFPMLCGQVQACVAGLQGGSHDQL